MPRWVEPTLATLATGPFSDPEWVYEYKWDGVRALTYIDHEEVRILSRNQKEIGFRYPELQKIREWIDAEQAIVDGEIVALGDDGLPSFQALQSRIGLNDKGDIARTMLKHPIHYFVFDLVYYNGFDLTPSELVHRKALLKRILSRNDIVRFSEHVFGAGEELYARARKEHMEGIVAKHQASTYIQKRSRQWLKIKVVLSQEVVIGGYTKPRGSRKHFGSLIAGLYQSGLLYFVGHVGGGFTQDSLQRLYELMQPLRTDECPFVKEPQTNEKVQWIKPALVCEVKFTEWTDEERLRQPVFLGLRDDKDAIQCTFEKPVKAAPIEIP